MRVNTIEQYHVLKFIKKNFNMNYILVEPVDRYTLKIFDKSGYEMSFHYQNGEVKTK